MLYCVLHFRWTSSRLQPGRRERHVSHVPSSPLSLAIHVCAHAGPGLLSDAASLPADRRDGAVHAEPIQRLFQKGTNVLVCQAHVCTINLVNSGTVRPCLPTPVLSGFLSIQIKIVGYRFTAHVMHTYSMCVRLSASLVYPDILRKTDVCG